MAASRNLLRRYTDLGSALDIVMHKRITMLPPSSWDDRNDRLLMETYGKLNGFQTLLAICLSTRPETYHHWKVSAPGPTGVCIEFDRKGLVAAMSQPGMRKSTMKYLTISQLNEEKPDSSRLPFLKRSAFSDEGEYRFVYASQDKEDSLKQIAIDLSIIEGISLSPWMPVGVATSIIDLIEAQAPGERFEVVHSKLIDNRSWRRYAQAFTAQRPKE